MLVTLGKQKQAVKNIHVSLRAGIGKCLPGREDLEGWLGSEAFFGRVQSAPEASCDFLRFWRTKKVEPVILY